MRITTILALSLASGAAVAKDKIPSAAQTVINSVSRIASSNDFAALRLLMIDEFVWSFGGDSDAMQAIDAWRSDKQSMRNLARITKAPCELVSISSVVCPANAGIGYRARFIETPQGWRMVSFVAGD